MPFTKKSNRFFEKPERVLVRVFLAAILTGTLLLMLPIASRDGQPTSPIDALFMATSATCVTGLVTLDLGNHFNLFGQLVLLCLIQLGGIGIITLGTFFLIIIGRNLHTSEEFVLMDSLGGNRVQGLNSLVLRTIVFAAILEIIGAAILTWRFAGHGMSPGRALYAGIFHSISAFCNSGLSIFTDNLAGYRSDRILLLTVGLLILLGGIGFIVLYDFSDFRIFHLWRRDRLRGIHLALHSRLAVETSLWLLAIGFVLFAALEWSNTLKTFSLADKLNVSLFHAITPRTAGFNVVDMGEVTPATLFMNMVLMFIGGSPCSTAGGIKTTTLAIMILVVAMFMRGRHETEIHDRTIPQSVVREALAIFILSLLVVTFMFGILLVVEQNSIAPDSLLFETISAFGTVGLSTGITPHLSAVGKLCIIVCMFFGRLGPLTVALLIGKTRVRQTIRYPDEEVLVG